MSAANTAASIAAAVMFFAIDLPQNHQVTERWMLPRTGFFQSHEYHYERLLLAVVIGTVPVCRQTHERAGPRGRGRTRQE